MTDRLAHRGAPGTIGCEKGHTRWSKCLDSLACSDIAQVFPFCFPVLTRLICFGPVWWRGGSSAFQCYSDWSGLWGIRRKDCFCLLDEMTDSFFFNFFFYIHLKVDPFIFTLRSYWSSRGGMLVGGPLITEWKTTSNTCRLEKGNELPFFPIQLTNSVQ